jgi:hypothetical protein
VLLISWVARQLGWILEEKADFEYGFKPGKAGARVRVRLVALPGPWIGRVKLRFDDGNLEVEWSGNFLETTLSNAFQLKQMLPAGGTSLAGLVHEELIRGGEHKTYLGALEIAEKIWTSD